MCRKYWRLEMVKRKTDLSRQTRRARRIRKRRMNMKNAQLQRQNWMEQHILTSFAEVGEECPGTSFEMEANWNAFSIAVTRTRMMNALNVFPNQNNDVHNQQQPPDETFSKEEVSESSSDTLTMPSVKIKLEIEVNEEIPLACESHFVNVDTINTFKVEPIEEE